jgi:hypothetical protein
LKLPLLDQYLVVIKRFLVSSAAKAEKDKLILNKKERALKDRCTFRMIFLLTTAFI